MIDPLSLCAVTLLVVTDQFASTGAPAGQQPSQQAVQTTQSAPASQQPAAEQLALIPVEKDLVDRTNAERARFGLAALEVDPELMQSARAHCTWMTLNHSLQHTRQPVAENIAMGQQSGDEAVRSWMGSSGHRANMLNPRHRRIGVAAYRTVQGTVFWCQQFRP